MRVFEIKDDWGMDNLVLSSRPEPVAGAGEVIIKMKASSLNFRDLIVPERGYGRATGEIPLIVLSDGVGEVVEIGENVSRVKIGDRVCPTYFQNWQGGEPNDARFSSALGGPLDGTMADYMCLSEQGVVKVPDYLSDAEAAALPCAALTGWSAIATLGKSKAGDKILIQGSGSVALFALSFAKIHGCHVTMLTSSEEKQERLKSLGADETINYNIHENWAKESRSITADRGGFDNIIELGGAQTLPQSLKAVRTGGTISAIGVLSGLNISASLGFIVARQVKIQGVTVGHRDGFEAMLKAMEQYKIKPVMDVSFGFEELKEALDHIKGSSRFGKTWIEH